MRLLSLNRNRRKSAFTGNLAAPGNPLDRVLFFLRLRVATDLRLAVGRVWPRIDRRANSLKSETLLMKLTFGGTLTSMPTDSYRLTLYVADFCSYVELETAFSF